jgi:hypothetical protein
MRVLPVGLNSKWACRLTASASYYGSLKKPLVLHLAILAAVACRHAPQESPTVGQSKDAAPLHQDID